MCVVMGRAACLRRGSINNAARVCLLGCSVRLLSWRSRAVYWALCLCCGRVGTCVGLLVHQRRSLRRNGDQWRLTTTAGLLQVCVAPLTARCGMARLVCVCRHHNIGVYCGVGARTAVVLYGVGVGALVCPGVHACVCGAQPRRRRDGAGIRTQFECSGRPLWRWLCGWATARSVCDAWMCGRDGWVRKWFAWGWVTCLVVGTALWPWRWSQCGVCVWQRCADGV
jgi:hypothetical protein